MSNNSPTPKVPKPRGRKPGSKDTKPRKPKAIGSNDGQKGTTSKPRAAVVPAWVQNRGMKPKHALFVAEYMVDLDAKNAAIRAGWAPSTAERVGWELLHKNQKTSAAIREALDARQVRVGITADKVVLELANIAFGKPTSVMTWGPGGVIIKDSESLAPEEAALVSEVSETKPTEKGGGSLKLKTHDKMKALELLGRHLGIFQDQTINRVQVQEVPAAQAGTPEVATFQEIMSKAKDRWQQQGYLNAPGQG